MNNPWVVFIMRGKCGHVVLDTQAADVKPSKLHSHGVTSLDVANLNCGMGMSTDCGCSNPTNHMFFNGKTYVDGKISLDYPFGPCDAAAPKPSASSSAPRPRASASSSASPRRHG